MKYLIAPNFKALRKGPFVRASEADGEFIFDDEGTNENRAQVIGILKANGGGKFSEKAKTEQLVAKATELLPTLKLATVNKMAETEKVLEIVKAGREAGHDNDTIMIAVMQSGIGYKKAVKSFENAMIELGAMIKPGDRAAAIEEALTSAKFNPKGEWDKVEAMVSKLAKEIPDTNTQQALSGIKKFLKAADIECPKRPAGTGGAGSKELEKLVHWMLGNHEAEEKAYDDYCEEANVGTGRRKVFKNVFKAIKTFDPAKAEGDNSKAA